MSASEFIDKVSRSVVGVRAGEADGSGWIATQQGLVVTNLHVVGFGGKAFVLYQGYTEEVPAKVIYADTRLDVAILLPEMVPDLPPLPMADRPEILAGTRVMAFGHPFGLEYTVTRGIVSAAERKLDDVIYVQHDAAISPGNSGGPLLDGRGLVLGINRIKLSNTQLNFAIAAWQIEKQLASFATGGALLAGIEPVYTCPECDRDFDPKTGYRCKVCGAELPCFSPIERVNVPNALSQGEHLVAELLKAIGYSPEELRFDTGVWCIKQSSGEVWIRLSDDGRFVDFASRLSSLPEANHEAFFRFLLTVNDRASAHCKISLSRKTVMLSFTVSVAYLDQNLIASRLSSLISLAHDLRGTLIETYGAKPALSHLEERVRRWGGG